ncbi:PTS fructose transporter subunit IIC [Aerococcus urinaehominis]|uniref:PTS fructose transporter subunit IIC n=1 Tax=Aerococcus urinaehominis TaxID=128944 RepID=A0A0X8FKY9_9LACT|nr:fructose-specific PTS transporter subunit EIIC [Aerococcus urinaehominis]AMB98542.1 PTS fructose transporter subunit IIC [Aerococcus urinaehominis]SDL78760.1 PTS system D-fructose-specific IIA component (F1P-forming), Frc family (TC 4.A.2.1.4)/PTS system D-fructose-specific IIB component (F1P-forming), Frc family (TC 4.A.2.1.4)/PTS system D-fructose-specific IIC component (F1P-forming), Frc family (TC 4.A.2.1.4) [Aerococcus urinaehominis]
MNLTDIIRPELMLIPAQATTKAGILDEMAQKLVDQGAVNDFETFRAAIQNREEQMSTGLGEGIAMPHAKTEAVTKTSVVFAKKPEGLDFESLDGQPAKLFFMIAAEGGAADTHLSVLAELSKLLMNKDFTTALLAAQTPDQASAVIGLAQAALDAEAKAEAAQEANAGQADLAADQAGDTDQPYLIAVTACPTGIAHTYMAEDVLKQAAERRGIRIKVETNGSDGVKHQLTQSDIDQADGIIVAVGKKVAMDRFSGHRVVQRPVADGINKTDELIDLALSGEAPIYKSSGSDSQAQAATSQNKDKGFSLRGVYDDLMSGISAMLPFVIAGGIMLAISFLLEHIVGGDSAWFTSFNSIGSAAFSFLIPVLAGYIAQSIGGQPALVAGFAGGALAVTANAGFLGGLVAGFLAGYAMKFIIKALSGMPQSLAGVRTILLYPVVSLLVVGLLMYFVFGPIFGIVNQAMLDFLNNLGTGNLVLLGALLGGMMAIDMGGPFNKAAYAFSIGIFTDTGDGRFMAAVMVGGMIPPMAIALATMLFKSKFTEKQQATSLTNLIMGLSFITEGAIPFAAADPLRVIGSSVIGAAIGGGLTQFWNTAVPAPHGGIFTILALGENRLQIVLAVLIGTLVSALILGFWKKPVEDQLIAEVEE